MKRVKKTKAFSDLEAKVNKGEGRKEEGKYKHQEQYEGQEGMEAPQKQFWNSNKLFGAIKFRENIRKKNQIH